MSKTAGRAISLALVLLVAWSCGPPPAPPGPGEARGFVPDLRGYPVMVFPIQLQSGVPQGTLGDPELAHALGTRDQGVDWIFPQDMEDFLRRSPSVPAQIHGLPVQVFLQAEVNRVGEPLYGHLVRLGGLTGADVALLPVELRYGEEGSYLLSVAIIATRTARVAWYGVVEGAPGEAGDPATLASVTEELARVLLPYG